MLPFDFGNDAKRVLNAIGRAFALIEFEPNGTVLTANENFCKVLGYDLAEIKGKHHSMFVEPAYVASAEYRAFWAKLGRGDFDAGEFKRLAKGGREVWIQASYNPVLGARGKVLKVVKVAMDVTETKKQALDSHGKLEAISRAQAMIEFSTDGTIQTANENFLNALGYRLDEIQGRHHRMFVDAGYSQSSEYQEFWSKLRRGEYVADEFKRLGKGGKQVWISASYNPIFDPSHRVVKVVKFATDITGRVRAVEEIAHGLSRLAQGDLKQRIDVAFIPSLDRLRVDFNKSVDALERSMTAIDGNAGHIRTGMLQISSAVDDLSQRTSQQASSLEETAAALEEITTTVRNSTQAALHGREVVASAKDDAEKNGVVVREAVSAINEINKSSKQISQIIGVIDEIAFQTNLLALNAGVEAARAGDAGRGFAVVASEVRVLAQRSAEAAKEIKTLISASGAQVENGVVLVTKAGEALERIIAQILDINQIMADISTGAQEQSTALQQVNGAIGEMDQTTQKNAAMVEETTSAAHSLSDKTDDLARLVGQFQISGGGEAPQAEDSLRRELKRAAPHAFHEPAAAAAQEKAASQPRKRRAAA